MKYDAIFKPSGKKEYSYQTDDLNHARGWLVGHLGVDPAPNYAAIYEDGLPIFEETHPLDD